MLGGLFGQKKKKKKLRYCVKVKGIIISKHTTKTNANKKAKGIRGARVMKFSAKPVRYKRKSTRRRRRY